MPMCQLRTILLSNNICLMTTDRTYNILVVDDEIDICQILQYNLEKEGYSVAVATSAEEALQNNIPDFNLLLLDVMMDGMSGFELASALKNNEKASDIPIIFLTAKDSEQDVLHGFGLGADDYISKPFRILELLARVKVVLTRSDRKEKPAKDILQYEGIVLNTSQKKVHVDGVEVPFTRTEFELLALLLSVRGRVHSRQELIDRIWPNDATVMDRTVDVNILRIRKKIEPYSSCIGTKMGYGYYFKD